MGIRERVCAYTEKSFPENNDLLDVLLKMHLQCIKFLIRSDNNEYLMMVMHSTLTFI